MFPWKMAFRFLSAVVLFATGGFAAGAELPLPFETAPPEVAAPAPPAEDTTTTTTPDETTTTTTEPTDEAPEVEPVPVDEVPVDEVPAEPADPPADETPTTPTDDEPEAPAPPPVGVPADPETPPPPPVDEDAPPVCAAAMVKICGPVEPSEVPEGDNSHAARVQRCQDWWNSLAQALDDHNRPQWAARARRIADRCDAMITRWEEAQKRWEERHKAPKPKGDHNHDGHPDNGWWNKGDRDKDRGRDDRPAKVQKAHKKIPRHSEGRR